MAHVMAALRIVFGTRAGLLSVGRWTLIAFGAIAGFVQFLALVLPGGEESLADWSLLAGIGVALLIGAAVTWPRARLERRFRSPDFTVTIKRGDLFAGNGLIGVGFTDTFDTDDRVISARSVQGQLVTEVYGGNLARLDADIASALAARPQLVPVRTELPADKSVGKLARYPIGTVLVLDEGSRTVLAAAYSRTENNLRSKGDVDTIWAALGELWDAADGLGAPDTITLPIFGSDLARVSSFGREGLVKLIVTSFVARQRRGVVACDLVIVVRPKDFPDVNMVEINDHLRTL